MNKVTTTVSTFDKYAKPYQEKFSAYEPYTQTYHRLLSLIEEDARILDVACGPATVSYYLTQRLPQLRVHGTDLAPAMIALAQQSLPHGIFELRDSRDIAGINKRFDVVIAGFCIPYLDRDEVESFVGDARALLRVGGILYLSAMEGDYAASGYQDPEREDRVYRYFYEEEFLRGLLENNGFEVIGLERKPYPQQGSGESTDIFFYARVTR